MTHILVTGGAGYIGSHTAKALAKAGFTPIVFDNLSRGHRRAVKWGPFIQGDLHDAAALDAVFRRYHPAAVMHFAAFAYVGESVNEPLLYYHNNVSGTLSLLQAMKRACCDRIVFSSTCATYGIPSVLPITEDTPQNPVNPYGASKLMVERILAEAEPAYDLKSISLRYFNAAGGDPDGELGEEHDPETHLIPLALKAAGGMGRLKVFGDDYDTLDGSCIRDYIHVCDLADAHILALRWLLEGKPSRVFNLGNGQGFSVFDVIGAVRKITGRDVPFDVAARRPGDPPVLIATAGRARLDLGWRPHFSSIETQIEHAWRFLHAPGRERKS